MNIRLDPGDRITPIRTLDKAMVSHWRSATDCEDIGGVPANTLR